MPALPPPLTAAPAWPPAASPAALAPAAGAPATLELPLDDSPDDEPALALLPALAESVAPPPPLTSLEA